MKRILISILEDDLDSIIDVLFEKLDLRERLGMDDKDKRRSVNHLMNELTESKITLTCETCGNEEEFTISDLNERGVIEV